MASKCSLGKSSKLAAVLNKLRIAVGSNNNNNTNINNENSDDSVNKIENQTSEAATRNESNDSTCIADHLMADGEILITPLTPSLESNDNEPTTEPAVLEVEPIPPDDFGAQQLKSTGPNVSHVNHTKFHFDDEELKIISSSGNVIINTHMNTSELLCDNKNEEQLTRTDIISETSDQTCDKIVDDVDEEKDRKANTFEKVANDKIDEESDMNNNEKLGQKKKSSRRKQQKTHKVIEQLDMTLDDSLLNSPPRKSSTDNYLDQQPPNESLNIKTLPNVDNNVDNSADDVDNSLNNISPSSSSSLVNVEDAKVTQEDFADEFILPEGTVFVQPESVDASPVMFNIETSRPKRVFKGGNLDSAILHCTACNKQIGVDGSMDYHRHPVLKVLICRKCYYWYTSAEVDQDSEGTDEQCRWCRQGGDLICCDFCHNSFCKGCIRRNLGRKELNSILDSDECSKWKCYVCNPKPLLNLIEHCSAVMEALTKLEKKQQEQELKRTKRYHVKSSTAVTSSTTNTSITLSSANSAVSTVCNGSASSSNTNVVDKSQTRLGASRVVSNNTTATTSATASSNSSRLSASNNAYFGIVPNSAHQVKLSRPSQQSVNAHNLQQQQQQHHKILQNQYQSINNSGSNNNSNNTSTKFILTSSASPPTAKAFPFKNFSYTSQLSMVEKLLSVTSSMQMFLLSLNDGLQKNKPGIHHNPTACTTATATTTTTTTVQSSNNKSALNTSSSNSNISKQNVNKNVSNNASSNNNNDSNTIASPSNNNNSTDSSLSPGAFIAKRRLIASKLWQAQQVFEKSFYNIAEMSSYVGSQTANVPSCTASLNIVNNNANLNASACASAVSKQVLSSSNNNSNSASANQSKIIISPKSYNSLNNSCNNNNNKNSSSSVQPSYISSNYVKTVHSLLNKNYSATNNNNLNNNTSAGNKHMNNNSGLQQQIVKPKVIVLNTPDSNHTNINRINNKMAANTRQNSTKSIISKSPHPTSSSRASILNKSTSSTVSSNQDLLKSSSVSRASVAVITTATTSASKPSTNSFYMVNRQFVKILPKIVPGSSTQVTSTAANTTSTNVTICGSSVSVSVGTSGNTSSIKSSNNCTSDNNNFVVVEFVEKSPPALKNNSHKVRNKSSESNSTAISTATTATSISVTAAIAATTAVTTTVTKSSASSKMANSKSRSTIEVCGSVSAATAAATFSLGGSNNVCVMKNSENDDIEEDILIISDSEDEDGDAGDQGDNDDRNNNDKDSNDVVNSSSSSSSCDDKTISNDTNSAVGIDNNDNNGIVKCMQTRRRKLSNSSSGNKIDGDGLEVNVTSVRKNISVKISNNDEDINNNNANNSIDCDYDSLAPSPIKSKKEPSKKSARSKANRNYESENVSKPLASDTTSGKIINLGQNVEEVDTNITDANAGDSNATIRRKKTEDVEDDMVTDDGGSSFKDGRGDNGAGVKIEMTTWNEDDVEGDSGGEPGKKKRKIGKTKDLEKASASGNVTLNGDSSKPILSNSSSRISTRRQTRLSKEQQQEKPENDEPIGIKPQISASSQSLSQCSASSSSSSLLSPKTVLSPTPPSSSSSSSSTSSTTLPLTSSSSTSLIVESSSKKRKRKLSVDAEKQGKVLPRRNSLPIAKRINQKVNKNVCNDKSTENSDSGDNQNEDGEMHEQKISKKKYIKPSRRK